MNRFADFDAYCEEHNVPMEDTPIAFAQWLADYTQAMVLGQRLDGQDIAAAVPMVAGIITEDLA